MKDLNRLISPFLKEEIKGIEDYYMLANNLWDLYHSGKISSNKLSKSLALISEIINDEKNHYKRLKKLLS